MSTKGGPPLVDGKTSDISLASLDGFECPTVKNEATSQGVRFCYVLSIRILFHFKNIRERCEEHQS